MRAPTPMSERTNDTYITSKVKARFVEQNKFSRDPRQGRHRARRRLPDGPRAPRRRRRRRRRSRRTHVGRRARGQAVRVHLTVDDPARPASRCPSRAIRPRSPTRDDALARIAALPRPLVFTNGVFDVLHAATSRTSSRRAASARRSSSRSTPTTRCGASARAPTGRSIRSPTAWPCSRRSRASTSWCRSTTTRRASSSSRAVPDVLVKGGDYTAERPRARRR